MLSLRVRAGRTPEREETTANEPVEPGGERRTEPGQEKTGWFGEIGRWRSDLIR